MLAVPDHVVPCPADHAGVIHAAMLEELAIFDGKNCLHEIRRNPIVGQQAALGAIGVLTQPGYQAAAPTRSWRAIVRGRR